MCPFHLLLACIFAVLDPSATPLEQQLSPLKVGIKLTAATGLFLHMRSTRQKVKTLENKMKDLEKKYKTNSFNRI